MAKKGLTQDEVTRNRIKKLFQTKNADISGEEIKEIVEGIFEIEGKTEFFEKEIGQKSGYLNVRKNDGVYSYIIMSEYIKKKDGVDAVSIADDLITFKFALEELGDYVQHTIYISKITKDVRIKNLFDDINKKLNDDLEVTFATEIVNRVLEIIDTEKATFRKISLNNYDKTIEENFEIDGYKIVFERTDTNDRGETKTIEIEKDRIYLEYSFISGMEKYRFTNISISIEEI